MAFDVNEVMNKIGANDMVKGLSEKLGVGAEQAHSVATDLLAKAQETGGGLLENAKEIAEKNGISVEKVEEIAAGLGSKMQEQAHLLGDTVTGALSGVMAKLNEGSLGGLMKGLDKDGDGNPLNDISETAGNLADAATDAVKEAAEKAKGMLGGLFGKKD